MQGFCPPQSEYRQSLCILIDTAAFVDTYVIHIVHFMPYSPFPFAL